MQRASGQYDDLARVPRAGPRQSSGRRSFAPRHWCRTAPRRSRGMEPTVRNPRIESAIGSEAPRSSLLNGRFPSASWSVAALKFRRRERNFWMQRPEAKNPPERPLLSAETGNSKIGVKNTRRNGLFSIDDGFRSSGRLDGGGSSRAKPVSDGYQGKIQGKNEKSLQKFSGEAPRAQY
jgi:hypothetical protein